MAGSGAESDEDEQFFGRTDGVHHHEGADGTPLAEICRTAEIRQANYFAWKKYGSLLPTALKRLKKLEYKNSRLKKVVAGLTLDREMLQDVIRRTTVHTVKALKPGRMRELVRGMCSGWGVSIRQACGAIGFDRSTLHYHSRRTDQAGVAKRSREICEIRGRYCYRRVHILMGREGWGINFEKVYRM